MPKPIPLAFATAMAAIALLASYLRPSPTQPPSTDHRPLENLRPVLVETDSRAIMLKPANF